MAWRIHDSVVRGELDNRTRGRVCGRLWLHGIAEPVRLELEGNACADLAGCELQFENPGPTTPLRPSGKFNPEQQGRVGDLTASRKVRVFDVPLQEACKQLHQGVSPPEHLANCLFLEWFSSSNGRIVVESADYRLTVSAPEWRLNPQEEIDRQATMERGWTDFLQGLTEAVAREQAKVPGGKAAAAWDEFDYEQYLKESDARTEKLMALYDRYEGYPDADAIIAREMGWDVADPDATPLHPTGADPVPERVTSADTPQPNPASEGIDWVRDEHGMPVHPLYQHCRRAGRTAWNAVDRMDMTIQNDPDVSDFICEFHLATARLAEALNGLAHGRQQLEAALIVAHLKRALRHFDATQAALDRIQIRDLFPEGVRCSSIDELGAIRTATLALVQEFRGAAGGSA